MNLKAYKLKPNIDVDDPDGTPTLTCRASLLYHPDGSTTFMKRHEWDVSATFQVSSVDWTNVAVTRKALEDALLAEGKTQVLALTEHSGDAFV